MSATFRSAGTAVEQSGTTLTFAYTLTAGDVLFALVSIHDELNAPTSVVWNGTETMTLVGYIGNSGTRGCGLYVLVGGTSGTHNVVVTHATSETMAGLAFGYSGVDTGTPTDGAVTDAEATGDTSLSVSVTSPAGDKALVVAGAALSSGTITMTNGTEQHRTNTANFAFLVLDRDGQGGATVIDGTWDSNPFGFATVGCNINAAVVATAYHVLRSSLFVGSTH